MKGGVLPGVLASRTGRVMLNWIEVEPALFIGVLAPRSGFSLKWNTRGAKSTGVVVGVPIIYSGLPPCPVLEHSNVAIASREATSKMRQLVILGNPALPLLLVSGVPF